MNKQPYPNLSQSFGIFGLNILFGFFLPIPFSILSHLFSGTSLALDAFFQFLSYTLPFTFIVVYFVKRAQKEDDSFSLNFNKVNFFHLLLLIPATLSLAILIGPLINLLPMSDFFEELMEKAFENHFISLITVAVSAPILEELLFRGVILRGLLKNYSPIKAIFWSAFIFGLVHLNPWQFIGAFLTGIFIGFVYWKTNSIIPGILIHFVNNFSAGVFSIYLDFNTFEDILNHFSINYYVIYGISVFILAGSIIYFAKAYKTHCLFELPDKQIETDIVNQ